MAVLWISLVIVILDQLTKFYIKGSPFAWLNWEGMPYGSSKPFIGEIMRLTFIENPGIAFGITIPGFKAVFGVFSIVASIGIIWYLWKNQNTLSKWERLSLSLILGGAVGNLIDRVFYGVIYGYDSLFYGRVVDFFDFGYKENWWPVFNIADSGVSVGVVLLMILLLKKKEPVPATSSSTVNATSTASASVSDASGAASIASHSSDDATSSDDANTAQHA